MQTPSPQAREIERLRAETRTVRKNRYRGMIALLLGAAGLAAQLAGLPFTLSLALWGLGIGAWGILKRA